MVSAAGASTFGWSVPSTVRLASELPTASPKAPPPAASAGDTVAAPLLPQPPMLAPPVQTMPSATSLLKSLATDREPELIMPLSVVDASLTKGTRAIE
jgi:hypothetical protein